ncbi:short-subunit dehydrogenase [Priestia taiwanensis]|uniref:glucose 1-dehydrogenase [NAD(P)(+)] n=2 Tax=Priestia taiwanensis TaxID=1347902 RepID=A0A917AIU4_9BACI|nr:short-subunit dehydrogenase [Priestia taiwanensis]GGE54200.1 oxidoreductase [Priestia taiwanensis]
MKELTNKVVMITGASSGIGEEMAYEVAKWGGTPILVARRHQKLVNIQEKITSTYGRQSYVYPLDVCDEQQVKVVFENIVQEVGRIDVLINNAGFGVFTSVDEADLTEVKEMFDVNVIGLIACTQAVLPYMKERNEGHIIQIASLAGKIATPKSSAYAATKHAVLGFTNALRMELANTNIHVTAINPGPIKTNFFDRADTTGNYVKSVEKYMLEPSTVAKKVVSVIGKRKREINLPFWMGFGPTFYALFPSVFEFFAKGSLNKK